MIIDDPRKRLLLEYISRKRKYLKNFRENEVMIKITEKLKEKYNLPSRMAAYELGVLTLALNLPPEFVANLLRIRGHRVSKKKMLQAAYLLLTEGLSTLEGRDL